MSDVVALGDCRSPGCREWVKAGRPYSDSKPIALFVATLRAHGFVVYTYPDKSHLAAARPEDHTPFSATGWPTPAPRWIGNACDQMPRDGSKAAMDELADTAEQMIRDRDAGVPGTEWLKYVNYTDKAGRCWHVAWQPNKTIESSTDRGHNHFSGRSDWVAREPVPYDPVARAHGSSINEEDDDMGASFGPIAIEREGVTSLTIPPVEAGIADPRPAWLNFCNDTGQDYALRLWYGTGDATFRPVPGTDGAGLVKLRSGERWSQQLKAGTSVLSIYRAAVGADGKPVMPDATNKLAAYAGHLTCAIERGAVKR